MTERALTVTGAAGAIQEELARGDEDFALRLLARAITDLRSAETAAELDAMLAAPPSTGDRRWDTLLATAVARECRLAGRPAPAWTRVAALDSWWFPVADPVLTARTMQRTPVDFSVRGIWLDARALETR